MVHLRFTYGFVLKVLIPRFSAYFHIENGLNHDCAPYMNQPNKKFWVMVFIIYAIQEGLKVHATFIVLSNK